MEDAGPLAGVRVLELGGWRPVAHAGALLADAGADVIKIEPPGGDPMRQWPQLWGNLVAGKRLQGSDLRDADERETVLALAEDADVVIEGWRPGTADRLGVGPAVVRSRNPRVVYCSISGYGQLGPLAGVPGHDINYQAWAGALIPASGGAPEEPALPVADLAAGTTAAFAISAALVRARATGDGALLDIAMSDVMVSWAGVHDHLAYSGDTEGDADPAGDPGYGLFATADGWVALGIAVEDRFWDALCTAIELPDLVGVPIAARLRRRAELRERVAAAMSQRARDELVADLIAEDVPAAPVLRRSEVAGVEHHRARGVITPEPPAVPPGSAVRQRWS